MNLLDDTSPHEWRDIGSDRPNICPCNKELDGFRTTYDDVRYARTNYLCGKCGVKFSHYYHINSPGEDMDHQGVPEKCKDR